MGNIWTIALILNKRDVENADDILYPRHARDRESTIVTAIIKLLAKGATLLSLANWLADVNGANCLGE